MLLFSLILVLNQIQQTSDEKETKNRALQGNTKKKLFTSRTIFSLDRRKQKTSRESILLEGALYQ